MDHQIEEQEVIKVTSKHNFLFWLVFDGNSLYNCDGSIYDLWEMFIEWET